MTAGFQVINAQNSILLNESYKNLCFITKGTVTLGTSLGQPAPGQGHTITQTALTIDTGLPYSAKRMVAFSSTSRVIGMVSPGPYLTFVGPPNAVITYYIFDVPPASTSTYGLVVYTSTGEVAFDALRKYARIVGTHTGGAPSAWAGTYTYPTGRTYAVVFPLIAREAYMYCTNPPADPGNLICYTDRAYSGASISGNTITLGMTGYQGGPTGGNNAGATSSVNLTAACAVLDVTQY